MGLSLDPRNLFGRDNTSYESAGVDAPAVLYREMGSSQATLVDWEVPELSTLYNSIRAYDRMVYNDVSADVSLRAAKIPVQNGYYYIDSANDTQEGSDIAEFVSDNLFHGTVSFLVTLGEILRMFEYGFSVLEKIFEVREWAPDRPGANRKNYTMLRNLAPRPALQLVKFVYDDSGNPVAMVHNKFSLSSMKADQVTIPIGKLLVFTMNKKGGQLTGKSLLRAAYKHWYYKDNFYKIDGIQKERHAIGIPGCELPPGWTEEEFNIAEVMMQNLRTNEKAYVVSPPGFKVEFLKPQGNLVDVLESANHHDQMIMKNVYVQFLNLGASASGSRAVSASQFDMYLKALRFVANYVCEVFNTYLIPQLVGYNFDTDEYPVMKVRRLGEARDLQMFAAGLANLAKGGLITIDDETEEWIREEIDMPRKKSGEAPAQPTQNGKTQTAGGKILAGIKSKNPTSND